MSIYCKNFHLKRVEDEVDFLRDMYNLTTQITALFNKLDQEKIHVIYDASKVLSLSSTKHSSFGSTTTDSSADKIGVRYDDLGIFEAKNIQIFCIR